LLGGENGLAGARLRERCAFVMQLVTREAGNHGVIGESGRIHAPRARGVDGGDQAANGAFEVHPVAAEAIIHQELAFIVVGVEKDVGVGGAVGAGAPVGDFLLMAFLAADDHGENIFGAEAGFGGSVAAEMSEDAADVVEVESGVEGEDVAVAIGAGNVTMRGDVPVRVGLPDLVAGGAGAAVRALVIGGDEDEEEQRREERG